MRFTLVSVALLALAHSLAPGVHGAPALASDHMNSLAVRQDLASIIDSLLGSLLSPVVGQSPLPPQVLKIVQQLQSSLAGATGLLPRALSSDATSPASSASLTTHSSSTTTTTSVGFATGTVSNASTVSFGTPQALPTPPTRMRRQLPTASVPSAVPSIVGTQSALQPAESILASVLAAASSKLVTSNSATSKPTSSKSSLSASQT